MTKTDVKFEAFGTCTWQDPQPEADELKRLNKVVDDEATRIFLNLIKDAIDSVKSKNKGINNDFDLVKELKTNQGEFGGQKWAEISDYYRGRYRKSKRCAFWFGVGFAAVSIGAAVLGYKGYKNTYGVRK